MRSHYFEVLGICILICKSNINYFYSALQRLSELMSNKLKCQLQLNFKIFNLIRIWSSAWSRNPGLAPHLGRFLNRCQIDRLGVLHMTRLYSSSTNRTDSSYSTRQSSFPAFLPSYREAWSRSHQYSPRMSPKDIKSLSWKSVAAIPNWYYQLYWKSNVKYSIWNNSDFNQWLPIFIT